MLSLSSCWWQRSSRRVAVVAVRQLLNPPPDDCDGRTTCRAARPAGGAQRVDDALPVPPQPLAEDSVANRSLDDLNRDSPLKPVFFGLDSADLDDVGRAAATANADVLKKYPTWVVTSRDIATSAAPPNTTWRSVNAGRLRSRHT